MKRSSTQRRPTATFPRLRTEHQRARERLAGFERALRRTPHGPRDEQPFRLLARYLDGPFTAHLAAEDGVLYPSLLGALPELALTIGPLRDDHAEIRSMTDGLVALLASPSASSRGEQLVVLGRDLTDLLRLHTRKEERALLDWGARVLPALARRALERRIALALANTVARNRLRT